MIEKISAGNKLLVYIVRAENAPEKTSFITPDEANLQVGYVVYPAGGTIANHIHKPMERRVLGTSEVLFVKKGAGEMDIFTDDKKLVDTVHIKTGDVIVIMAGGHGFRLTEDTVLIEVKQGPYTGIGEKERF